MKLTVILFLLLFFSLSATAQDSPEGYRGEVLYQLEDVYSKLLRLAEAIPEEQFSWRPDAGVRSVSEALLHVAESNYFLATILGVPFPEGYEDRDLDVRVTEKEEVLRELQASREFIRDLLKRRLDEDDLTREVDWFDPDFDNTVRGVLLHMVKHSFEHHGQVVAYARMNGIVPPWSR